MRVRSMSDQPGLAARCALGAIRAYQRHLSPRKGFRCALRGATGGRSCSGYGYRAIARCGLRKGLRLLQRRLDACASQHRRGGPSRYQQGYCDIPCDVGDMSGLCDGFGSCCSCDLASWPRRDKKPTTVESDFSELRARVEAAKRKNNQGK